MIRSISLAAMLLMVTPAASAGDDPEMQAYIASMFDQPGKAAAEFEAFAKVAPFLTAYSLSLFTEVRCGTGKPEARLLQNGGGMAALETSTGKKILLVAGVVATMKFKDEAAEANFCANARSVVDSAIATLPPK